MKTYLLIFIFYVSTGSGVSVEKIEREFSMNGDCSMLKTKLLANLKNDTRVEVLSADCYPITKTN